MLWIWILVFIVSLFILIKSSDYFTDYAEKIGLHFGMPHFLIGITILAIGTSLPELVSSIIAVLEGSSEIVIGDVVGSNIANVFLVLGFIGVVSGKIRINYENINMDSFLMIGSSFLLVLFVMDGSLNIIESVLFICCLLFYLFYSFKKQKKLDEKTIKKIKSKFNWNHLLFIFLSIFFIYVGAKFTIKSMIEISSILGIGKEIIAITALALGTSLPELFACLSLLKRKNYDAILGNIVGSNIFNILSVMGISGLFGRLAVPDSILSFSLPVMIFASFIYLLVARDKKVTRIEGVILLVFYFTFIIALFV